ncbi:MAG: TrkH family potassium uptake protein, partial [Lachnospiraceae bacterium]|nr:TrkH family potassium uptake protein [Lachnospiraceae bacterium]
SVGKLVPKVKDTAFDLYAIYFVMTMAEVVLLAFGGMSFFESLTISFGTAGTGGLSIWNDSIMSCTPYQQWVIGIFMVLFGVNFSFYFLIITGKIKQAFKYEEVRVYFVIIAVSVIVICINIYDRFSTIGETIRHAFFQVGSIITTTGYGTADFDAWPALSKTILVMLMFIGACAGSTGGGIKVSRIIVMAKTVKKEIISFLFPKSVKKIKIEDKVIGHETLRSINVYIMTYIFIFALSLLLISYENKDMTSNFTAIAATFNNIGPGLSKVGPTQNFTCYSTFSKYVFMFDMLAGRLELFPILLLFSPSVWKHKRKVV